MKNANMISKYLVARHREPKQRLQFPSLTRHKKHYEFNKPDQVKIGHEHTDFFVQSAKRDNNLNVADIEGAMPKASHRSKSEQHLKSLPSCTDNGEIKDQLDNFVKSGLHKRQLSMKQLGPRNQLKSHEIQNNLASLQSLENRKAELKMARDLHKNLKTEPTNIDYGHMDLDLDKYRIIQKHQEKAKVIQDKKNILQNPTYLSNLFFA